MYPAALAAAKQPPELPVRSEPQTSTVDVDTVAKALQALQPVASTEQGPNVLTMQSLNKSLPSKHCHELELAVKPLGTEHQVPVC